MTKTGLVTRRLLSIEEAATYTGLSKNTLYKMISQRRIPYVKLGSRVKFDAGLLDDWVEQNTMMPMPSKNR